MVDCGTGSNAGVWELRSDPTKNHKEIQTVPFFWRPLNTENISKSIQHPLLLALDEIYPPGEFEDGSSHGHRRKLLAGSGLAGIGWLKPLPHAEGWCW